MGGRVPGSARQGVVRVCRQGTDGRVGGEGEGGLELKLSCRQLLDEHLQRLKVAVTRSASTAQDASSRLGNHKANVMDMDMHWWW